MILVYALVFLLYVLCLQGVDRLLDREFKDLSEEDDFEAIGAILGTGLAKDPGYEEVMEICGYTWWNTNPIYVLKHRHCPNFPGYECHTELEGYRYWPRKHERKGFFELGKGFRHVPKSRFDK